jgi:hypothetical protein
MPSTVAGSTKPKTLRHPQQRPPSVFAAFMDEVPHFQTSERVPFAQLQDAVDHFANGLAMSLRFGLLRLSREYLFDVDLDGHTPRTSLRSQPIRNVDGNFHRAILAAHSAHSATRGSLAAGRRHLPSVWGSPRPTPVTNKRPDPIFRMRAGK